MKYNYKFIKNKILLRLQNNQICGNAEELLSCRLFRDFLRRYLKELAVHDNDNFFGKLHNQPERLEDLIQVFINLTKMPLEMVNRAVPQAPDFTNDKPALLRLVEGLYNDWRSFDRYIIYSAYNQQLDQATFRAFHTTVENLTHLMRQIYRDIERNISGRHPRIYRQVRAGAEIAVIAAPMDINLPDHYAKAVKNIPLIRQMLLYPPLIIKQPMNKRTGRFEKSAQNPFDLLKLNPRQWLCYPAKVGKMLIFIYFHEHFNELGLSLSNLFELADDDDLQQKPDAIYFYGVGAHALNPLQLFPTVFHEDKENDLLVAACPREDRFGYFGYLKKMVLTLHNIKTMRSGKLPFHGALVEIMLQGKEAKTVLIIGDTGAGKSETLEAFREMGQKDIRSMKIIADDMGMIEQDKGQIIGYGTEIGAFLRLDDLKPGYAYGQLDRAIIMNPSQTNARIVIPVSNYSDIIKGHRIDMILYANNYEEPDNEHPLVERFNNAEQALHTFREGTVMSKGTTTSTGIVHSYFANIFGPAQYKPEHEAIATRYFPAFFAANVFVGQMRTRLGIPGWEHKGPEAAAYELLETLKTI